MSAYDRIVRQTFRALVPGHALFITPGAQPATGHDDAGLHVHFPTTNELATAHFGQLWPPLTQPLKYQLISYLAGHEAMHAWEMVRGYRAHPANTLRGLVANILADIRIDHSPVLRTLAHWPLNRDIAYRVLDEPLIPPADLEPAELPHHNALRVLNWGLAMLRCGRLRQSDGTTVQAPTHPLYAQLWPQVLAIMIEARNYNWHTETDLLDRLLDLLRGWTRHQPPPTPADDNSTPDTANTAIVDAEHPDTTEAADAHNPFHWQDEQDQPPTTPTSTNSCTTRSARSPIHEAAPEPTTASSRKATPGPQKTPSRKSPTPRCANKPRPTGNNTSKKPKPRPNKPPNKPAATIPQPR